MRKLAFCAFVAVWFVAFSPAFITIGLMIGWSAWSASRVEGRVVGMQPVGHHSKGDVSKTILFTSQIPIVEYQVAGKDYRILGHLDSLSPNYAVGESVIIGYPPGQPAQGRLDAPAEKWLVPLIFIGWGLLCALIGLARLRNLATVAIP